VRRVGEDGGGTAPAWGILLRVTFLLSVAAPAALALRRASAALRHLVWTLSLAGTLLIPLVYCALPAWHWAILPRWQPSSPASSPSSIAAVKEARSPAMEGRATDLPPIDPLTADTPAAIGPGSAFPLHPSAAPDAESVAVAAAPPVASNDHSARAVAAQPRWSWSMFLAVAWASGTCLGLAWIGIGVAAAWHIARRARPAADSCWQFLLRQLLDQCGARRPVSVRECSQVSVPMTWGLRRPVILVPTGSAAWSTEVQRSVLLHELGHIRRSDCLMLLLGRLACAAYWFHPLAWLAIRQLRKTSEQAADDLVLASDIAPLDYAEHLVGIAAQMRGLHWFGHVALPMASPSDLEGRVKAILDPRQNHRCLKRKTRCALMLAAVSLLIPCALLRLGYAQPAKDNSSSPPASSDAKSTVPTARAKASAANVYAGDTTVFSGTIVTAGPLPPPAPPAPPVRLSAAGTVLDAAGKPVAGASVYLNYWTPVPWLRGDLPKGQVPGVLADCRTDAQGEFRFHDILAAPADAPWNYRQKKQLPWDVVVVVPRSALAWQHLTAPEQPAPMSFRMQPEAKITGRITDEKGRPIEGAEVSVRFIQPLGSELFDFTPMAEFLELTRSTIAPPGKTDADGRVTLAGLPPERRLWLDLKCPGRHAGFLLAATTNKPQPEVYGPVETAWGELQLGYIPVQTGSFSAVLKPARRIEGAIVEAGSGKPLAGISVVAHEAVSQPYASLVEPPNSQATSDAAGRFVFPDMPRPRYNIIASAEKSGPHLGRLRVVSPAADQLKVEVRIELPRGEPLVGRVVNKQNSKGVAGLSVTYAPDDGDGLRKGIEGMLLFAEVDTNADGHFRLFVAPGKGTVEVAPRGWLGDFAFTPGMKKPPEHVQAVNVVAGQTHPELVFSIAPEAGSDRSLGAQWTGAVSNTSMSASSGSLASLLLPKQVRPPIEGTALDPDGRPNTDATVGLQPWFESTIIVETNEGAAMGGNVDAKVLAKRFVRTDASGHFVLRDIGVHELGSIQVIDRQRQLAGIVELPSEPVSGVAGRITVRLSPTGSVSGVAMKDGKPCPGVHVTIEESPLKVTFALNNNELEPGFPSGSSSAIFPSSTSFRESAETDREGRFHFATVPGNREYTVRVYSLMVPEKNRQSVRVTPGKEAEVPPYVFLPTIESVSGIVVDLSGKPVAGASIIPWTGLDDFQDNPILSSRVKPTGADGRFTITGLPKIPLVLNVGLMVPDGKGGQRYAGTAARVRVQPGQKEVRITVDPRPARRQGTRGATSSGVGTTTGTSRYDSPSQPVSSGSAAEPKKKMTTDSTKVSWGEPLKGLRTRLTAPDGPEYRQGRPFVLRAELQNISDKPIAMSTMARPNVLIKAEDAEAHWLGIAREVIGLSPWEGRSDSLAPGEALRWEIPLANLRFLRPIATGATVKLHIEGPVQEIEPGRLPIELKSNAIGLTFGDAFPTAMKAADLPEEWSKSRGFVYRCIPGLKDRIAYSTLAIDGSGRATVVVQPTRNSRPVSVGRTEKVLSPQRLNQLMKVLRQQEAWNLERIQGIINSDESEVRLCLVAGSASMIGTFPMHVVQRQPALAAIKRVAETIIGEVTSAGASNKATIQGSTADLVVVGRDNRPISDAEVQAYDRYAAVRTDHTDQQGIIRIPADWSNADGHAYFLLAKKGESVGWRWLSGPFLRPGTEKLREGKPLRIVLSPCDQTLEGTCVDREGSAMPNVPVLVATFFTGPDEDGSRHYTVEYPACLGPGITDARGHYSIKVPNYVVCAVYAEQPDYVPVEAIYRKESPGAKQLVLKEAAGRVHGRVVDAATGSPIRGARVFAQALVPQKMRPGYRSAASDANGEYSLTSMAPGLWNVLFSYLPEKPDWTAVAAEAVEVKAGATATADFRVAPGRLLSGAVIDAEKNAPMAGVSVGYYGSARPRSGAACLMVKANSQGRFEFHVPPGESYVYVAESFVGEPKSRTLIVERQTDPEPVVFRGVSSKANQPTIGAAAAPMEKRTEAGGEPKEDTAYTLRGTLRAADGKPVPGAIVGVWSPTPSGYQETMRLRAQDGEFSCFLGIRFFDDKGQRLLKMEDNYYRDRIGKTRYLVVNAAGYARPKPIPFTFSKEIKPLEIVLERPVYVPVRGRVLDAKGQPIVKANVSVSLSTVGEAVEEPWGPEYFTNKEGRFDLKQVHVGNRFAVRITKEHYLAAVSPRMLVEKPGPIDLGDLRLNAIEPSQAPPRIRPAVEEREAPGQASSGKTTSAAFGKVLNP